VSIENDAPDEPEPEPRRKGGWQQAGPGRPGPGEMGYRKAYELSLAKWGPGGRGEDKDVGSLRWVQQRLFELGYNVSGQPPSIATVTNWIKKGRALRDPEVEYVLGPIHLRDKTLADAAHMMGVIDGEYEDGKLDEQTKAWVALKLPLLKLVTDVSGAGAAAAVALEINHRMPAGMTEKDVRTLRLTDPSAMTDAERADALAAYDTRRRNGSGGVDAASGHADPDDHGSVTP
jgi:hypothetical protein